MSVRYYFLALAASLVVSTPFAQTPPPLSWRIAAQPQLGTPGTPRVANVHIDWNNVCRPELVQVKLDSQTDPTAIEYEFKRPSLVPSCQPSSGSSAIQTKSVVPNKAGSIRVTATLDGVVVASGAIVTGTPEQLSKQNNLSGLYFDPSNPAMFVSVHAGVSDQIVGMMNLFGERGAPRWQVFFNSRRTPESSERYEADWYEYTAPRESLELATPGGSLWECPSNACPAGGFVQRKLGTLIIDLDAEGGMWLWADMDEGNPTSGYVGRGAGRAFYAYLSRLTY
jgi:hypothetical protein